MVDYPYEWWKYMVKGKIHTFKKDTPEEIIKKAKKMNESYSEMTGKPYFHFEEEIDSN